MILIIWVNPRSWFFASRAPVFTVVTERCGDRGSDRQMV